MKLALSVALTLLSFCCLAAEHSHSLALELHADGLHDLSALEFRRAAKRESIAADEKASFLTAAAWEYRLADNPDLAVKMLDDAETTSRSAVDSSLLLRGDIALEQKRIAESEFFFQTLTQSDAPDQHRAVASSRLAVIAVARGKTSDARAILAALDADSSLVELEALERTRPRSPRLGGILGMIPGLGYAYSGEYANGLRSLILNGIFIYAMSETGSRDQWGTFTALSFFELTWYTGSIYGGIDAAHRFNTQREELATGAIMEEFGYQLDLDAVPSIRMEFTF